MLENIFHLKENHTDAKTEIMAGITTFMTMAYILAVNPNILSASGMDSEAVLIATALASFVVKTSCEKTSGDIKGIVSPINGEADVLIFPNIESGNAFYKAVSLFSHADMAGLLQGPICPVVLPSRSDSGLSKYYSIAMACLTSCGSETANDISQLSNCKS